MVALLLRVMGRGSPTVSYLKFLVIVSNTFSDTSIDRTIKMYIGGAQKRPNAPYAHHVVSPSGKVIGQVGEGNRKDIRDAVEAAHKAAPG